MKLTARKTNMKLFVRFSLTLFLAVNLSTVFFSQNTSILALADQYSLALKKFQAQRRSLTVEGLLRKGQAVGDKLDELESLNDADYAMLVKKMKGFDVNRQEVVFINPDSKFFARLSRIHGTRADIAFFTLMQKIRPDNVWAAYTEQQTDYSGCTIYGKGLLTSLYRQALQFRKTYPKAYTSDVKKEIDAILEEFTMGTCACGDRKSVLKEFWLFIRTFPKDKKTPEIRKRLEKIEKSTSFRFYCQSG